MTDTSANNKRIAKNTLLLYIRMLFLMAVSLYTSRVVLQALGVEDFGIYNVVGGIVAMFGFLNAAMASSTQRYLTFALGRGDADCLRKVFNTSIIIHALISLLVVLLAETVGLWFFYQKMVIPPDRLDAAMWVYQFSVLSSVVMIMSVPYNSAIIAHERMSAFAYISILEVLLKLLIVFLLRVVSFDRLAFYALLIFMVQLGIRFIYSLYCSRHFEETKFCWTWDRPLFREMLSFAGWNLCGNCAAVSFTQGLNLLLNMFFGPVVNAARGIAVQVQATVQQFSSNFQTAVNPQITKSYAVQDYDYMHSLIFRSSKFTFFLLLLLSLPVMLETDLLLKVWLETVPDYTVVFLRLMLCITIVDGVAGPLMVSAAATGRVRLYQGVVGGVLLCILPMSYLVLKLGGNPASVFLVHLGICLLAFIVRLFIIRPMIRLSLRDYSSQVVVPCLLVAAISVLFPFLLRCLLNEGIVRFILIIISCVICVSFTAYRMGLSKSERRFVLDRLQIFISKFRR